MSLKNALSRTKALLTPRATSPSSSSPTRGDHGFQRAPTETALFPRVVAPHGNADTDNPSGDDDDGCEHDCATCSIRYPRGFKIDETEHLYGHVNGWDAHLVVATGRSDWVRDVADEKGSLMMAVRDVMDARGKGKEKKQEEGKGKGKGLMVSASNMPVPEEQEGGSETEGATRVLLLPRWVLVERVTPERVAGLIEGFVDGGVTNTSPLADEERTRPIREDGGEQQPAAKDGLEGNGTGDMHMPSSNDETESGGDGPALQEQSPSSTILPTSTAPPSPFETRPCPHNYLILLCSHRTRDARCGQSAPLLRKEFERQLRPLGLYRDLHDERPGGVGIYFINHVGGHKFSANVMVYRRAVKEDGTMGQASQCIWLARVRPEDCEPIVKFTVLQGKVVKPQRQLRGGFDREKGLVSW